MKGWILYKESSKFKESEFSEVDRLVNEAIKKNIEITVIDTDNISIHLFDGKVIIFNQQHEIEIPQFIIPRIGVYTDDYCLTLLQSLGDLGCLIFNTYESILLTRRKSWAYVQLSINNIPIPNTFILKSGNSLTRDFVNTSIVKVDNGTQGLGNILLKSNQIPDFLELLNTIDHNETINIQKFIKESEGKVIRVLVLNGVIIASYKKIAENSYKAVAARGAVITKSNISNAIADVSIKVSQIFKLNLVGIDFLIGQDNNFYVCDVNSSPSFIKAEELYNLNIAEMILNSIKKVIYTEGVSETIK